MQPVHRIPALTLAVLLHAILTGCHEATPPDATSLNTAPPTVTPPPNPNGMVNTPFIVPPLVDPPLIPAAAATLKPDEPVVGVSTGQTHTAWPLNALSNMQSHVVHDTPNTTPLAVTYCDRSDCVRVFSGQSGQPLQLQTAGFINGEMWLRVDGQMLPQSSPSIPLEDYQFTRTTWQEWATLHPDTTVFLGPAPAPDPAQSQPAPQ